MFEIPTLIAAASGGFVAEPVSNVANDRRFELIGLALIFARLTVIPCRVFAQAVGQAEHIAAPLNVGRCSGRKCGFVFHGFTLPDDPPTTISDLENSGP